VYSALRKELPAALDAAHEGGGDAHGLVLGAVSVLLKPAHSDRQAGARCALLLDCAALVVTRPAASHNEHAAQLGAAWPRFFRKLGGAYDLGSPACAAAAAHALFEMGEVVEVALLVREYRLDAHGFDAEAILRGLVSESSRLRAAVTYVADSTELQVSCQGY